MPLAKPEILLPPYDRMLIVGYGTMAGAMVEGWLAAGMEPAALTVYNPRAKPVPAGVRFTTVLPAEPAPLVLLAFKPQVFADVAPALAPCIGPDTVVISVLAGIERAGLREHLPGAGAYVRFMPNLAAAINKSPNALIATPLSDEERIAVTRLAAMLGSAHWLEDEALFDLVTAVAGSGPAFVYRFAQGLTDAAVSLGLPQASAEPLVLQMLDGAATLAVRSAAAPGELAARVASKGGMTQAGLDVLDEGSALEALLAKTLRAARDRGRELGRGTGGADGA